MRWLFYNPNDPAEAAEHQRTLDNIDRWWKQFQTKTADLHALFAQKKKWDLPGWMHTNLQPIDPELMWEFGPGVRGAGHRLVITPEGRKDLRPLTATIIELRPRLDGWEFYTHRLAEDLTMARQTVEGRTGGSLDDVLVEVRLGENHRIDLIYRSPRTTHEDDQQAMNDAFVVTETLLGEEALDKWVGVIEVGPLPRRAKPGAGLITLDRLKDTFDALIGSMKDRLPPQPCWQWVPEATWSLLEVKPTPADDYSEQLDMFVAVTSDVELWQAMHTHAPFSSDRYSRWGETFVYVKIEGSEGLEGSRFADRSEIEEALNTALTAEQLGIGIGGGTGLRYSYIDLALTDLPRGIDTVRRVLRDGRIPQRSWVLFFDADLCGEWVGIYDETPAPPSEVEVEG